MVSMRRVGLDVHAKETTAVVFDGVSGEIEVRRIAGRPERRAGGLQHGGAAAASRRADRPHRGAEARGVPNAATTSGTVLSAAGRPLSGSEPLRRW